MTISAQQPQITLINFPVLKTPCPCVNAFFWANFLRWINMVYIKCTVIVKTTNNTLPSKLFDQSKFALPVSRMCVYFMTVFIPVIFSASIRTKPYVTILAALFAFAIVFPPMFQIAFLVTVFAGTLFNSVRVNHYWFAAPLAFNFNRIISHWRIISQYTYNHEPKYFDIAVERITQAQKQVRMFP